MATHRFNLSNTFALVTASSAGLGWAIAQALAEQGSNVVINGRNQTRLETRLAQAKSRSLFNMQALCADFTDLNHIPTALDQLQDLAQNFPNTCNNTQNSHLQNLAHSDSAKRWILINCVGIRIRQALADFSLSALQKMISDNLTSTVYLSQQMVELMKPAAWGRIITLSSIAGRLARAGDAVYPITKIGLEGMVRSMAVEYAPLGITSNGIAPGFFATETNAEMMQDTTKAAQYVQRVPMKRWGQPDELSGVAVLLASDAASYINGQIITVDGGLTANF